MNTEPETPELLPAVINSELPVKPEQSSQDRTDPHKNRAVEVNEALLPAYQKASTVTINPEEERKLREPFPDDAVEVRPHDGLLYIPHIMISERLNDAFGVGAWAMIRRWEQMRDSKVYASWILMVKGAFIGETVTGHQYVENNPKMDYADALESTRGDAIRRIAAKDLGCGCQVWKPTYCAEWEAKYRVFSGGKYHKKRPSDTAPKAAPVSKPKDVPPSQQETPEEKLARWVEQLKQGDLQLYSVLYYIDMGKLLPNEGLEALRVDDVPKTAKEAKAILDEIRYRASQAGTPPTSSEEPPTPSSQGQAEDEDNIAYEVMGKEWTPWREAIIPFGKNKGKMFGEITKQDLWWWCCKWEPKPYKGNISEQDAALRVMLDQLKIKYEYKD